LYQRKLLVIQSLSAHNPAVEQATGNTRASHSCSGRQVLAPVRTPTLYVCLLSCQQLLLILQLYTARSQLYVVLDATLHGPRQLLLLLLLQGAAAAAVVPSCC
jgi:hypothetical protein